MAEDDLINARNPHAGPELFSRALDRAVLSGAMSPEAVTIAAQLYKGRVVVNASLGTVELDGADLDTAVARILDETPLFRARAAEPAVKARSDLEALALGGNLTAYAKLQKEMKPEVFAAWRERTGAQPGKAAVKAGDKKIDPTNPWSTGNRAEMAAICKRSTAETAALAKAR